MRSAPPLAALGLAAALAALAGSGRAQQRDFSAVEVKTEKLADGVYVLIGAGGNIGLSVGDDGPLLIDDQFAPLAPKIVAAVAALNPRPVRFVLNTHWHGDHTGGNETFGRAGAVLVSHDNVRRRLSVDQFRSLVGDTVRAAPRGALPIVTFNDSITFHVNGQDLHVAHVPPAHTDGDAVIFFRPANVVHTGDTFFNGVYPVIDLSSGGSVDGMIAACDRILAQVDERTRIIPGHGPVGDKGALQAFRAMLVATRDQVTPLVRAGRSLDEVKRARPTREFDERWARGSVSMERYVTTLYEDARRKPPR